MTIRLMQDFRFSQRAFHFSQGAFRFPQSAMSTQRVLSAETSIFHQRSKVVSGPLKTSTSRSKLAQAFADRLFLSDGGAFLITGYRGVGKTTFVHEVLQRLIHNLQADNSAQQALPPPLLLDVCLNIARPLSGVELMHFILRQLYNRMVDLDLLYRLPHSLRSQLRLAFLRTSAMLAMKTSEEAEASMSLEKWLSFSSKVTTASSRDINYLAYDERSAENDLIALAQQLAQGFKPFGWFGLKSLFSSPIRLKLLFVFDELDKIDEAKGSETSLTDILHTLKTLFTTSGISFIFVAGRALHERWQQDVQRGDSVFESVFSESRYLPAVWDQVDEICDPFLAEPHKLTDYDSQLYCDFKRYLAYTGRGIPRRILRGFYERVCWDGTSASLALSEHDRRQMRFHAELYQLLSQSEDRILGENSRELRPDWLDKQRLGLYYILDWILARGTASFTLAEVIDAASNELKVGIAPAREMAPRVVTGLIEILCNHHYVEKFTDINETLFDKPGLTQQREKYRLMTRRLIEMGYHRDSEAPATSSEEMRILSGRYQLMELLGQGASAQVFRALDRMSGRIVAVKRFNSYFFSVDSSLQERLREEANVQYRLRHSGIAEMLDVAVDEDAPYIVMEYLEGVTLHHMLEDQGKLPLPEAMTIVRTLLDTMHYLHTHGVIWRDVKPSNILLTVQGRIVIVDFGTAQTMQNALFGPDTTRVGFAAGTPAYMSPEQVRGEAQTPASDLFSLGVILFEMITGEKPWPVNSPVELYQRLKNDNIEALPAFHRIPVFLQTYVSRALNIDPNSRFQSAQEMLEALPHTEPDTELIQRIFSARQACEAPSTAEKFITMTMRSPDAELLSPPPQAAPVTSVTPMPPSAPAARATTPEPPLAVDFSTPLRSAAEVNPSQLTYPRGYALLTVKEAESTRYFGLFGNRITLGRAQDCDIRLNDSAASRYHACIVRNEGIYQIEDMNSSNGLIVNRQRIYQQQTLENQDTVSIGQTELVFEMPQTLGRNAVAEEIRRKVNRQEEALRPHDSAGGISG